MNSLFCILFHIDPLLFTEFQKNVCPWELAISTKTQKNKKKFFDLFTFFSVLFKIYTKLHQKSTLAPAMTTKRQKEQKREKFTCAAAISSLYLFFMLTDLSF